MKLAWSPAALVAAAFALLWSMLALADPLHKFGGDGAWRHEGSGWMFPRQVGDFDRHDAPYTIDGNNDVGAEYATLAAGARRSALVDVYYADSAASGATLEGAKTMSATKRGARLISEQPFAVNTQHELVGIKATYEPIEGSKAALYFFKTPHWVVTVRTTAQSDDADANTAFDELVRALPWDTLDSDPGDLHAGGS